MLNISYGNYEEWLINSLKDKEELYCYIRESLEAFQEDDNYRALLYSLKNAKKAIVMVLQEKGEYFENEFYKYIPEE